ncbi:hypothetical protein F5148DRAFT_1290214 [Russula earlei]|uniref:Uncharacterized protein n=1 Tax=Russula earlei TaxID=71964 RepID=A0ACC0TWZ8_9AGAM|nr:hypothetical protein F5148DRAFT_1290214 [Russula earlei]
MFCLAVGIAPSFAHPPRGGNSGRQMEMTSIHDLWDPVKEHGLELIKQVEAHENALRDALNGLGPDLSHAHTAVMDKYLGDTDRLDYKLRQWSVRTQTKVTSDKTKAELHNANWGIHRWSAF